MRISDWSSDVCSSDLGKEALAQHPRRAEQIPPDARRDAPAGQPVLFEQRLHPLDALRPETRGDEQHHQRLGAPTPESAPVLCRVQPGVVSDAPMLDLLDRVPFPQRRPRSEAHTSELQSLMRISYA